MVRMYCLDRKQHFSSVVERDDNQPSGSFRSQHSMPSSAVVMAWCAGMSSSWKSSMRWVKAHRSPPKTADRRTRTNPKTLKCISPMDAKAMPRGYRIGRCG